MTFNVYARFQASVAVYLRHPLFWDVTTLRNILEERKPQDVCLVM